MRSGLAGLFFFLAAVALALVAGGWWLQRIAFDTSTSADVAVAVLRDEPALRNQVVLLITNATSETLGIPAAQLGPTLDQTLQNPPAPPSRATSSATCTRDSSARAPSRCRSPPT